MRERIRRKLIMPDVVGLMEQDAQIMLSNAGFAPGTVRFVDSYDNIGSVIEQYPIKGQLIDSNSSIKLNVSKQSYVRFLPQIYQVDSALGNSFLKEFLWVFQHIVESLTEPLDDNHKYYDPREAPAEFLPWLASWVALTLDVDWPPLKKRQLIRAAAEKYRYRGTRRALIEMLNIFIGKLPTVRENHWPYRGFRVGISSTMGEDTIILPRINLDHCFVVHIPVKHDEITEEMVVKIHNIINLEKPAHTTYFLQFKTEDETAKPQLFMQIGVASTVGDADLRYEDENDAVAEADSPPADDPGEQATETEVSTKAPAKQKSPKTTGKSKTSKKSTKPAAPKPADEALDVENDADSSASNELKKQAKKTAGTSKAAAKKPKKQPIKATEAKSGAKKAKAKKQAPKNKTQTKKTSSKPKAKSPRSKKE